MSPTPAFINPSVLERLTQGSFVPARKSSVKAPSERRNALSPLAITKRCIRYEPQVFTHRRPLIIQMAQALNDEAQKILLVGGPQGIGKTSLVRGLIELMGSRQKDQSSSTDPQLLWFDVNRHTDFEEIIQFLIQYITEVCTTVNEQTPATSAERRMDRNRGTNSLAALGEDPLKRLESQLQQVQNMPLLLVLDNVEYIVDTNLRLNSFPFKELLNFLLGFPNIKMVLIGERLPYADMSPNQDGILDIQLDGLSEAETIAFWQNRAQKMSSDPAILERELITDDSEVLRHLARKTQGAPWLIKTIDHLHQHANLEFDTLNRLLDDAQNPTTTLVQLAYERLPDQHRRLFQTLSFLRHSVNAKSLLALMSVCFPLLDTQRPDASTIIDLLEHSLIRPFLKISFPPQQVLNHIRNRHHSNEDRKYPPWFELYFSAKQALYQSLPSSEQSRIHDVLQDFYLRDKANEAEQRVLRIKNRAMMAEAKYHGSLSRSRTTDFNKEELSASFSSKAYIYQQNRPLNATPSHKTLDDYRQIQLPETTEIGPTTEPATEDFSEASEANLTFESPSGLPSASFTDILSSLELNEDERSMLTTSSETIIHMLPANISPQTENPLPEPESKPQDIQKLTEQLLTETHEKEHTEEEERIIQKRLAAAVSIRDANRMARELLALARYRASRGRYDEALHCLDKTLQIKTDINYALLAEVYQLYGTIYKETYQHNAALTALSKAAASMKQVIGDDNTVSALWMQQLGRVYQDLGEIQIYRKQYTDASDSLLQALQWYQIAGEDARLAEVHFQLAGLYEDLDNTALAIEQYQQALILDERFDNWPAMAAILANLGNLYWQNGQTDQALHHLNRSLTCDQRLSEWAGQLRTLETIAKIQQEQEAWIEADNTLKQGLAIAMQQRLRLWQATFYTQLGQLATIKRNWTQALQYYEAARSCGENELSNDSLNWLTQVIAEVQSLASRSV